MITYHIIQKRHQRKNYLAYSISYQFQVQTAIEEFHNFQTHGTFQETLCMLILVFSGK